MRKIHWGPVWLALAVVALGLAAWGLTLERADKLASVGSFVIAAIALVAAARVYLHPADMPRATKDAAVPQYQVHNELSGDGQMNVWNGDNTIVNLSQESESQRRRRRPKPDRD